MWKSHVYKSLSTHLTGACARTFCPLFEFMLSAYTLTYHSPATTDTYLFEHRELAGFRMVALKFLLSREKTTVTEQLGK